MQVLMGPIGEIIQIFRMDVVIPNPSAPKMVINRIKRNGVKDIAHGDERLCRFASCHYRQGAVFCIKWSCHEVSSRLSPHITLFKEKCKPFIFLQFFLYMPMSFYTHLFEIRFALTRQDARCDHRAMQLVQRTACLPSL